MKVLILFVWTIVLVALLGAAFVVYRFLTRPRPKAEPYFRFLCPHCKRKLHYRAHKAGRQGICPRCKQRCTFPLVPNNEW